MRILSVDYGERRTGLAISDEKGLIASPLPTLKVVSLADAISKIHRISESQNVNAIVVGLPLSNDRSETQESMKVRYFADSLKRSNGKEIIFWNELYTSQEAASSPLTKKKKKNLDSEAARIILQEYLDNYNQNKKDTLINNSFSNFNASPKI